MINQLTNRMAILKLISSRLLLIKELKSLKKLGFIRVIKTTEVISMINLTYKMTFLNKMVKQSMSNIYVLTILKIKNTLEL